MNGVFLEVLKQGREGNLRNMGPCKIDPEEVSEVCPSEEGPGFSLVRMKNNNQFTIYSSDAYKINRLDE